MHFVHPSGPDDDPGKKAKSPTLSAGIFELGSENEENAERLN